jgi:two-component system chemotaxis response regulator CheB
LAIVVDRRAIAVVLSGKGNDGATGATAIHDFGGVVIAADEASSKEFSMPSATIGRDDAVDHVAHVDKIAALLESITRSRDPSDTL